VAIDNPIDAVESQHAETNELSLDLILSAGELAFPLAAPVWKFIELINGHLSKSRREERVRAFFGLLRDQQRILDALGNNYEKLNLKVEDLAEAAQIAAWRDAEAFNDNKRDRYLKILGNAARSTEQIEDLAAFIRDVEVLGEEDIAILKVLNRTMNKASDWADQFGQPTKNLHPYTFIQRRQELAAQIAEALGQEPLNSNSGPTFSHEEGYSICARLQGFGLAHETKLFDREVPIGDYCFRPSKRGLMLLRLMGEEVPNWEKYFPPQQK
jgi:hypothetical protein